ncbi:DUF5681 domain-containing protein [Pseudomonas frederiksbergensis]|uniref:DUF5681 domain-containing protein n=1 Tax=Pseudomonas frederiksbergensis TaxID=104087 RepID=UPI003D24AF6B
MSDLKAPCKKQVVGQTAASGKNLMEHVGAPECPGTGKKLWQPGHSGNPKGRPRGSKNKRTVLGEDFEKQGAEVMGVVIEAAKAGDMTAAGLVLARLAPPLRAQSPTVQFDLDRSLTLTEQAGQVVAAVAEGQLSPDAGKMLLEALSAYGTMRTIDELAEKLEQIERRLGMRSRQ